MTGAVPEEMSNEQAMYEALYHGVCQDYTKLSATLMTGMLSQMMELYRNGQWNQACRLAHSLLKHPELSPIVKGGCFMMLASVGDQDSVFYAGAAVEEFQQSIDEGPRDPSDDSGELELQRLLQESKNLLERCAAGTRNEHASSAPETWDVSANLALQQSIESGGTEDTPEPNEFPPLITPKTSMPLETPPPSGGKDHEGI